MVAYTRNEIIASSEAGKRLGAVLLNLGMITAADLDLALSVQKLLRKGKQADAALLIMDYRLSKVAEVATRVEDLAEKNLRALDTAEVAPGEKSA